jgi:F420-dependent oxidoreductase-like protein
VSSLEELTSGTVLGVRVAISGAVLGAADVDFVVEADRLGAHSVWVPEAWGQDALTPLAYLAARTTDIRLGSGIVQIGARTPANLAMTAGSLQALSGGRFLLGLGTSGPQVMEGWHGIRFASPLSATRETVAIVRQVAAGHKLEHHGRVYDLPLPGGPGRPIRSMLPPAPVPVYIAALGPKNLALTGEIADGWIGNAFLPERADAFLPFLDEGLAAAAPTGGRSRADLDLLIPVAVEFTDDVDEAAARHARGYAFTIGAMGSKDTNFYNAAFARQGFGDDVAAVQDLWLAGRREEAAARVPLEIGLKTNLLGTPAMVKDRLRLYRRAGITTLQAKLDGDVTHKVDTLAQLLDLVHEVNAEAAPRPPDQEGRESP